MWHTGFQQDGKITLQDGTDYPYTGYNADSDTTNEISLKHLSTSLLDRSSSSSTTSVVSLYTNYFGADDYAHRWILAAFDRSATTGWTQGFADFSLFQEDESTDGRYL